MGEGITEGACIYSEHTMKLLGKWASQQCKSILDGIHTSGPEIQWATFKIRGAPHRICVGGCSFSACALK